MRQNSHLFYVFLLLAASAFVAISCKKDNEVTPSPSPSPSPSLSLIGKWNLAKELREIEYEDGSTKKEKEADYSLSQHPFRIVEFNADSTVSYVQNTVEGEFLYKIKGNFSSQEENKIRLYRLELTHSSGSVERIDAMVGDIDKLTLDSLVFIIPGWYPRRAEPSIDPNENGSRPKLYTSIGRFSVAK